MVGLQIFNFAIRLLAFSFLRPKGRLIFLLMGALPAQIKNKPDETQQPPSNPFSDVQVQFHWNYGWLTEPRRPFIFLIKIKLLRIGVPIKSGPVLPLESPTPIRLSPSPDEPRRGRGSYFPNQIRLSLGSGGICDQSILDCCVWA
jgi:hypothetical protein